MMAVVVAGELALAAEELFLPWMDADGRPLEFGWVPERLPTGCPDFTVERPRPHGGAVVDAADAAKTIRSRIGTTGNSLRACLPFHLVLDGDATWAFNCPSTGSSPVFDGDRVIDMQGHQFNLNKRHV